MTFSFIRVQHHLERCGCDQKVSPVYTSIRLLSNNVHNVTRKSLACVDIRAQQRAVQEHWISGANVLACSTNHRRILINLFWTKNDVTS